MTCCPLPINRPRIKYCSIRDAVDGPNITLVRYCILNVIVFCHRIETSRVQTERYLCRPSTSFTFRKCLCDTNTKKANKIYTTSGLRKSASVHKVCMQTAFFVYMPFFEIFQLTFSICSKLVLQIMFQLHIVGKSTK